MGKKPPLCWKCSKFCFLITLKTFLEELLKKKECLVFRDCSRKKNTHTLRASGLYKWAIFAWMTPDLHVSLLVATCMCVRVSPLFQDSPAPLQNRCGEGRRGICWRATAASCLSAGHTVIDAVYLKPSCRTQLPLHRGSFQASVGNSSVGRLRRKCFRKTLPTCRTKCELFEFEV